LLQRSIRGLRWMLESVREIHGHVNKQLTNHSSATEREIGKEYRRILSSNFLTRLVKSWATCNTGNFFAQQSCSTVLRVWHQHKTLLPLHQFPSYLLADKWTCGNRAPIFALSAHKYRLGLFYLNLRDIPCHTSNNTAAAMHTSWFLIEFQWAVMATSKRPNLEPKKPVKWEVFYKGLAHCIVDTGDADGKAVKDQWVDKASATRKPFLGDLLIFIFISAVADSVAVSIVVIVGFSCCRRHVAAWLSECCWEPCLSWTDGGQVQPGQSAEFSRFSLVFQCWYNSNFSSAVKSNQFQYFVKSTSNWPKTYSVTK